MDVETEPKFVAYYTNGNGYKEESIRLEKSLNKFNLDYEIAGVPDLGDWNKNTHYKPTFIKDMLIKHKPKPIIYIDVDAEICQYPEVLMSAKFNFAIAGIDWSKYGRKRGLEIISSVVYFANTETNMLLVDKWIELCVIHRTTWDQKLIASILPSDYVKLPDSYCKIFDKLKGVEPVIKQYQASRRLKIRRKL